MIAELLARSLVGLALFAGLLLPFAMWVDRRQVAALQGRAGPSRAGFLDLRTGLLQPLADTVKLLAQRAPAAAPRLAPWLALAPAVLAFGFLPYAARYAFGSVLLRGVVADTDVGLLCALVLLAVGRCGAVLAGIQGGSDASVLGGLRAAADRLSVDVLLGLSLVPMVVLFGSLRPSAIAAAQDRSIPLLELGAAALSLPAPPWLGLVVLPAWGLVLHPIAFVLFLAVVAVGLPRPSTTAARSGPELAAGHRSRLDGPGLLLDDLADRSALIVMAGLCVTVFLGSWAIPWLPQERLIAGVASFYGEGVGTIVCLLAHGASFVVKMLGVIAGLQLLAAALPWYRPDQRMAVCWRRLLPLALANVFATALVLAGWGEG